jgi:threonine aldolase
MARRFAAGLAGIDGITIDPSTVETNIVRYRLDGVSSAAFVDALHERGVWMLPSGADGVRAVFYLDITEQDLDDALEAIRGAMATLERGAASAAVAGY